MSELHNSFKGVGDDILFFETGKPRATTIREVFGTKQTIIQEFLATMQEHDMPGATELPILRAEIPIKSNGLLGVMGVNSRIHQIDYKRGYLIGTDALGDIVHSDFTFTICNRIYLCEDRMLRITAPQFDLDQQQNFKNFTGFEIFTGEEVPHKMMPGERPEDFEPGNRPLTFRFVAIEQLIPKIRAKYLPIKS